ncbi:MAG: hypothetical protein Q7J72_01320 [Candidatus Omnitrophota bacterium]|nr:hypothetical protein [Candidatus Omnitrophota bacterium]
MAKADLNEFIRNIKNYMLSEYGFGARSEYCLGPERWCFKADIACDIKNGKLIIEIEQGQPHPDTNVAKYWYWLEKSKYKGKLYLIQVFGREFYDNNYKSRADLCQFVAEKISKCHANFKYMSIPGKKSHKWEEDWRIQKLLPEVKNILNSIIKKINKKNLNAQDRKRVKKG